ncbi:MAG: LTA synthase family protein [Sphingobacteriaceae bacterium]
MLKHLNVLIRFLLFWIAISFLDRLVFVSYFASKLADNSLLENTEPFLRGLRLDLSLAGYLSLLPLLVYLFKWIFPSVQVPVFIGKTYTGILICLMAMISIANLNIYREWGSKLNYRALDFAFSAPNEAMASSASSPILLSFLLLALFLIISFWLSSRFIVYAMPHTNQKKRFKIPMAFLLLGLTFLAIRGGWQLSPINQSMSYYSQKPLINHASVNTYWNLLHDITKNLSGQNNPYQYTDTTKANELVDACYPATKSASPAILTQNRPNVVVIILESFTADLVESLGGEKGIAPQMEQLIQQGILFENAYASGDRTDKGTIAILSGFPSQAIRSIIKEYGKQERLPSLAQIFRKNNYRTSFYYGGESEFFGMKSYILGHGYQKLIDKPDFEAKDMNSKWGAYDGKVYQRQLADLNKEKQPFFSTLLSLTNHEPFELPVKPKFPGNEVENKFRSTAFYADSCLGSFIKESAKQPWYKNTLFVIVADHGHRLPLNKYDNWHPNRFRIPLIFFGEVIKPEYRGMKMKKFGGQTDIAHTLLRQVKMDVSPFKWSKDLLNEESKDFAFFDWDNGFGWATPQQAISFDNMAKQIIYRKNKAGINNDKALEHTGKAYLQKVYQEYLNY